MEKRGARVTWSPWTGSRNRSRSSSRSAAPNVPRKCLPISKQTGIPVLQTALISEHPDSACRHSSDIVVPGRFPANDSPTPDHHHALIDDGKDSSAQTIQRVSAEAVQLTSKPAAAIEIANHERLAKGPDTVKSSPLQQSWTSSSLPRYLG